MNIHKMHYLNRVIIILFCIGILSLMLSQIPLLNSISFFKNLSYLIWFTIFIVYLLIFKVRLPLSVIKVFFSVLPIYIYSLTIAQYFSKELFFFRELNLILLMILIGGFVALTSSIKILNMLLVTYIVGVAIVVVDAYFNYLKGNLFTVNTYLYPYKNSLGAMIVNSIIILMYTIGINKRKFNIVIYILITVFLFVLLGIQNRSGIIVLAIIFLINVLINYRKTFKYTPLILLLFSIAMYIWGVNIFNFLNRALLLESLSTGGIDAWSSSRFDSYIYAWMEFKENMMWGSTLTLSDNVYIESFYLQFLSSYGLFGTLLLGLFISTVILKISKSELKKINKNLYRLIIYLMLSMFSIAIVEQSAPFGPGAVYFISWLLIGYAISFKTKKEG